MDNEIDNEIDNETVIEIDSIIEIPVNSNLKLEVDYGMKCMRLDRVLETCMGYPGNYGYMPNTLGGDGDAIDTVMPIDYKIPSGTVVRCRVVGVLLMEDESGVDEKLIVYPCDKVDARFSHIKNLTDIRPIVLNRIRHFFSNYKGLSEGKFVNIDGFRDRFFAKKIIEESIKRYRQKQEKNH